MGGEGSAITLTNERSTIGFTYRKRGDGITRNNIESYRAILWDDEKLCKDFAWA